MEKIRTGGRVGNEGQGGGTTRWGADADGSSTDSDNDDGERGAEEEEEEGGAEEERESALAALGESIRGEGGAAGVVAEREAKETRITAASLPMEREPCG